MKNTLTIIGFLLIYSQLFSQGALQKINNEQGDTFDMYCGSHFLNRQIDQRHKGFMEAADNMLKSIAQNRIEYRSLSNDSIYVIPVVFHIIYNNDAENLPDSVIHNQIALLNQMYRRRNADTSNLREPFKSLVGDAQIEFRLAETDPDGNATDGIVRTETSIANFGGILPYGPGQNAQINQWVQDSLMLNMFRLTEDTQGGSSPWDTQHYLNIWSGDLRIWEPQFNVEEQVFFALATPPLPHPNWTEEMTNAFAAFNQGVLVHYLNVGSNNPNTFPAPYQVYNGLVNKGKTIIHEVGHYLGLRHIWGDGPCNADDHIDDTPKASNHSQFTCNPALNSCVDTINGVDLPNMIENYMDYSNSDCQNSFTLGQINVMREVLKTYRPNLATTIYDGVDKKDLENTLFSLSPNPTKETINLNIPNSIHDFQIELINDKGQVLIQKKYQTNAASLKLELPYAGLFLLKITYRQQVEVHKLIKL